MGTDSKGHRAGSFKQVNKAHKTGRHRSKGAIDKDQKGLFIIFHRFLKLFLNTFI